MQWHNNNQTWTTDEGYKITEESPPMRARPFRLETPKHGTYRFADLEDAKTVANLLNGIDVLAADNEALRAELDECVKGWPPLLDDDDVHATEVFERLG